MSAVRSIEVTLSADLADLIDAKVASGLYASASDVVSDGLRALDDDTAPEWLTDEALRRELLPVIDAVQSDPSRGIPLKVVFDRIEKQMQSEIEAFELDPPRHP